MSNLRIASNPAVVLVVSACAHTETERPPEMRWDDDAKAAFDTTKIFRGDPDDASSKPSDYVTSATPLKDTDLETLWEASDTALRMEGYTNDSARTSYEKREMFAHWDTYLSTNRFEGKRHRAIVKIAEAPEGGWMVSVVVQMQRNVDIANPSNAAQANWEDMAPAATRASVILYRIESGFREPGDRIQR